MRRLNSPLIGPAGGKTAKRRLVRCCSAQWLQREKRLRFPSPQAPAVAIYSGQRPKGDGNSALCCEVLVSLARVRRASMQAEPYVRAGEVRDESLTRSPSRMERHQI